MKKHTTLVISVSSVLNGLIDGLVTADDLEGAVFFISERWRTASASLLTRAIIGTIHSREQRLIICRVFSKSLDVAKQTNRVAWRHDDGNPWEQLNELLDACGLSRITPIDRDYPPRGRYAYSWVKEAVNQQQLPYRVIW